MIDSEAVRMTEVIFQGLLEQALPSTLGAVQVEVQPSLGGRDRPDFIVVTADGQRLIVEAEAVAPATRTRLDDLLRRMLQYRDSYRQTRGSNPVGLVVAFPNTLGREQTKVLLNGGITRILDGPTLRAAAPTLRWPKTIGSDASKKIEDIGRASTTLLNRLDTILPGRSQWSAYQKFVGESLGFLLTPPLSAPLPERSNETGVNRRDVILPNYAVDGFWHFLRTHYEAHFIVADAKNYVGAVKKNDVLQVANYLSAHGAGLFGLIICRGASDRSAEVTRREQWVIHRKMIIVLNDEDIRQMFELKESGQDPSEVVKQKVEDFRLGF